MAQFGSGQNASSLLRNCLSQLGLDTWTQTLLPKLLEDSSADNVALTCRELRNLCHSSVQELNLTELDTSEDTNVVLGWMQQLPQHFAGCTRIELLLDDDTNSSMVPVLWNGIGRLHKLHELRMQVHGSDSLASSLLEVVLPHTPSLRSLVMQVEHSWVDQHKAWNAMGQATQLTNIDIFWSDEVGAPCTLQNLQHLSTLTGLKGLGLHAWGACEQPRKHKQQQRTFLGLLTALQELSAPVVVVQDLRGLTACSGLQDLILWGTPWPQGHLGMYQYDASLSGAHWAAVAQLTSLTRLQTDHLQGDDAAASVAAIGRLSQLRSVFCGCWVHEMLPVFQQMPHLTCIDGGWQPRGDTASGSQIVCPQVKRLSQASGDVPCGVFPNIVELEHVGDLGNGWEQLGASHKSLRAITADKEKQSGDQAYFSFLRCLPEEERVASILSLTSLTALSTLQLSTGDDAEMVAFATAANTLVKHGLRHVDVLCSCTCCVSVTGLLQFAKVVQLPLLDITVQGLPALLLTDTNARMLLSGLNGLPRVQITCRSKALAQRLQGAHDWLDAQGLMQEGKEIEVFQYQD